MSSNYPHGIDDNTILYLRGDAAKDLSFKNNPVTNDGITLTLYSNMGYCYKSVTDKSLLVQNVISYLDYSKDFTFEWYECPYGNATAQSCCFHTMGTRNQTGSVYSHGILYSYAGSATYMSKTSGKWDIFSNSIFTDRTLNTRVHWALVKQGTKYTSYKNGKVFASATASGTITKYDNNMRLFLWCYNGTSGENYNAYINHFRVSNIARYTEEFTPPQPFTSVNITDLVEEENSISCQVYKGSESESISSVKILINDNVISTITENYDSITINKENLIYGENNIEVRAYYYDDGNSSYYINKSITCLKKIELENIVIPSNLPNNASLTDANIKMQETRNILTTVRSNLISILNANGFVVNENNGLVYLTNLFSDLTINNPNDINELTNRILELESNVNTLNSEKDANILALKNALINKGIIDIDNETDFSTLISKIDQLNLPSVITVYSSGTDNTALTGGWTSGYIYTTSYGLTETPTAKLNSGGYLHLEANQGSSSCGGRVHIITKKKIDVTAYKTLKIRMTTVFSSAVEVIVGLNSNLREGTADNYTYNAKNVSADYTLLTERTSVTNKTYSIDLSKFTGSYYLEFQMHSGTSYNRKCYIYEISLS